MIVMRILGLADGRPCPVVGEYIVRMDFEAHGGRGELVTTPHRAVAKQFKDAGEAFSFWQASPKNKPMREDGKPNRPLTAYTIAFD